MVYNTGNGASLQKLLDKTQNSGRQWILQYYCWKLKKKESKTVNTFQKQLKLLGEISQSPQYNQSRRAGAVEKMLMRKLPRTQQTCVLTDIILVPYLNNSSEVTIFGSNTIKEQHERIKLQNEVHVKP